MIYQSLFCSFYSMVLLNNVEDLVKWSYYLFSASRKGNLSYDRRFSTSFYKSSAITRVPCQVSELDASRASLLVVV